MQKNNDVCDVLPGMCTGK